MRHAYLRSSVLLSTSSPSLSPHTARSRSPSHPALLPPSMTFDSRLICDGTISTGLRLIYFVSERPARYIHALTVLLCVMFRRSLSLGERRSSASLGRAVLSFPSSASRHAWCLCAFLVRAHRCARCYRLRGRFFISESAWSQQRRHGAPAFRRGRGACNRVTFECATARRRR